MGFVELLARGVVLEYIVCRIFENALASGLGNEHFVVDLEEVRDREKLTAAEVDRILAGLVVVSAADVVVQTVLPVSCAVLVGCEGELAQSSNVVNKTCIYLGGVDLLGYDEVVAERSHCKGHIAVALDHAALHVEYVHGVGVAVIEIKLLCGLALCVYVLRNRFECIEVNVTLALLVVAA